jgi:hypothetical protein
MLSFIRRQLSATNLMVVAALIFAMAGGAFAANGGGSAHTAGHYGHAAKRGKKGKSKPLAKRGPRGPEGKQGPAGPAGPKGETGPAGKDGTNGVNGKDGTNGTNGTNGANGESVNVAAITEGEEGCEGRGGAKVSNKTGTVEVCNGKAAAGGGYPATLPEGAQETGTWNVVVNAKHVAIPISFPVKLKEAIVMAPVFPQSTEKHAEYIELGKAEGEPKAGSDYTVKEHLCKGTAAKPEAAPGILCVFEGAHFGYTAEQVTNEELFAFEGIYFYPPTQASRNESVEHEGTGTTGAMMTVEFGPKDYETAKELSGTWALGGN